MPIYEYECNACGSRHEFIQKFDEGPKRKCPQCGEIRLRKLVSAAAFHLKGGGWYVTDFRDKRAGKKGDEDTAKTAATGADEAGKAKAPASDSGASAGTADAASSDKAQGKKKAGGSKAAAT